MRRYDIEEFDEAGNPLGSRQSFGSLEQAEEEAVGRWLGGGSRKHYLRIVKHEIAIMAEYGNYARKPRPDSIEREKS